MTLIPKGAILHFIGLGGIGMSGIAEVLHTLGYRVQGSDHHGNANIERLQRLGIRATIGHAPHNIDSATVVVVSTAVKADNPELLQAQAKGIPVIHRSEILAELMRCRYGVAVSGTHGKTTTTSLCAALFEVAGLAPTVINGGIINSYASNAKVGQGEWVVAEADESDGSFLCLPATIAVITNIDAEHMDHYKTFDHVRQSFQKFIQQLPFYGLAILCHDHPEVRQLDRRGKRSVTYGLESGADIQAINLRHSPQGAIFDIVFNLETPFMRSVALRNPSVLTTSWQSLRLPLHGRHNVQNSLVTVALALELGLDFATVETTLASFAGVQRRFTQTGKVDGITIIDDYAHHPAEISAVLAAARFAVDQGRVIAVFQPHRYTRLADLMDEFAHCFDGADDLILAPVYSAGEPAIPGITTERLREKIIEHFQQQGAEARNIRIVADEVELADVVAELASPQDFVVCMGAGSVSLWAHKLPQALTDARLRSMHAQTVHSNPAAHHGTEV